MNVLWQLATMTIASALLLAVAGGRPQPASGQALSPEQANAMLDRLNRRQALTMAEVRELAAAGYGARAFEILRDKFPRYDDNAHLMAAADPDRAFELFKGWLEERTFAHQTMAAAGLGDCGERAIVPLEADISANARDFPLDPACRSLVHIGNAGVTALVRTMREHPDAQSLQSAGLGALAVTAVASPAAFDIARERLGNEKSSLQTREAALAAACHNASRADEAIHLAAASAVQRDLFNCPKVLHEFGAEAYPTLLKMLDDPRPQVRRVALEAIARPPPEALDQAKATLVPPITKLQAADPDRNVRRSAKSTLYQISTARNGTTEREALEHRVAVFCDPHQPLEDRRRAGVWLILPANDVDRFVPKIIAMLKDPDWVLAGDACQTLGALGPHASPAVVSALFDATADPKRAVADNARIAITGSGAGRGGLGDAALPLLEAALRGSDPEARKRALEMVPFFAGAARVRLNAAVDAAHADAADPKFRLGRVQLAPNDAGGLSLVLRGLSDPDADIRREARVRLARFVPNEPMLAAAESDLTAEDLSIRRGAAELIARACWEEGRPGGRFKPPGEQLTQAVLRILTEAVRDPHLDEADFEQVYQAFTALGRVAAPSVESLAGDSSPSARQRACALAPFSPHALQLLSKLATDPSAGVRSAALLRLRVLSAGGSAPVFITASTDADPAVRAEAASALLMLAQTRRTPDPAVLAALQKLSNDRDPLVRRVMHPELPEGTQPGASATRPAQTRPFSPSTKS